MTCNVWKVFLESWKIISRRNSQRMLSKKKISLYSMILWRKHKRVLKLLSIVYTWSSWQSFRDLSHTKICSIKINTLLVWIPITWWFSRTPKIIHNLLLPQGKHARISEVPYVGLQRRKIISTYLLYDWSIYIYINADLSFCLSVYLYIYLSILSAYLSIYL